MKNALPSANNVFVRRNGKRIVFARTLRGPAREQPEHVEQAPDDESQAIIIRKNGKHARPPSRSRIGARTLSTLGPEKKNGHDLPSLAASRADNPESAAPGKPKTRGSKKNEWEPIATFVVEFELREGKGKTIERRTRAHHHEATVDKEWPGFIREELCHWMAEQIGEEFREVGRQANGTKEVAERIAARAGTPNMDWRIACVRLLRSGNTERVATLYDHGRCMPALISAQSPFVIELSLERADETGNQRPVQHLDFLRFRAYNRDTRKTIQLGQTQVRTHDASGATKTLNMSVSPLATAGSYRLEWVPVAAGIELRASTVAVPVLQVI